MTTTLNEIDKKLVQTSAAFADVAYAKPDKNYILPPGNWIPLDFVNATTGIRSVDGLDNAATGYQARAWANTETRQIYFANAGTNDMKEVKDWSTVLTGSSSSQFADAIDAGIKVKAAVTTANSEYRGYTVITTGHSWGEVLAQIQSYVFGWKGVGFDGPGAWVIISAAGFLQMVAERNIIPAGKSTFISCNVAGVGPFAGSLVGNRGEDIPGTRSCMIEPSNYIGVGIGHAIATFVATTPYTVLLGYVAGKLISGVYQHDMGSLRTAVEQEKFSVTNDHPVPQPYHYQDEQGNTLSTLQDNQGKVRLGSDGQALLEMNLKDDQGKTYVTQFTTGGMLQAYTTSTFLHGHTHQVETLTRASDQTLVSRTAQFDAQGRIQKLFTDTIDSQGVKQAKSHIIFDNNRSAAPLGVSVGLHQFYVDAVHTNWEAISKSTGITINALLTANTQATLVSKLPVGSVINLPIVDNIRSPEIHITPHPETRTKDKLEGEDTSDINAGYAYKTLTASVVFKKHQLNSPLFTYSQQASLTTGHVRAGATQNDANPRPASWFSTHHYKHNPLLAASVLGSFAAGGTQQVFIDPIVLDLGKKGIALSDYQADGVLFDIDHSGQQSRTGWLSKEDGLLVHDVNGDGIINDMSEVFSEYSGGKLGSNGAPGTQPFKSGFDALRSLDSNRDNLFDAKDAAWGKVRVWIDANHDSKSWIDSNQNQRLDAGESSELKTLSELGITQIDLLPATATPGTTQDGNRVLYRGRFTMHGEIREALGVHFVADPGHHQWAAQGNGQVLTSQLNNPLDQRTASSTKTYISTHTQGETLNAQTLGVIHLYGSTGNDTLIAAASGSWMVGGGGSNHYRGGAGDDVFVISSQDQQANIDGAGGTNTAIFLDDKPITLNMAQANIHIAHGGKGNATIISGGRTGVYIKGGEGYNTLIGGAGTDVIVGGTGYNLIIGGTGKSVMYGGANGNTIYGAADESIIHLGGGTSQVVAGDRNDVIKVGTGTATVDGGGGINILELQGSYADYQIDKINNAQGAQFRITDKMRERNGTVTFKNIQKLNFSDISAIDLTSPNAMPVTDMLRVNATGHAFNRQQAQLISAAQLLANDHILNSQGKLRISALSDVVGGVATLTSSGDILFTPHAQFNGMMRFKYSVTDAAGNAAITVQNLASGQTAPMRAQVILLTPELPNDPLVAQQWYLNDTHILPVWKEGYSGKGIRIGQFEPGGEFAVGSEVLDYQHPDLAANIDEAWLRTHQTAGTLPTRFSNHATMVAGIMVAANNDSGAVGVAYNAKIAGYYLANNGSDASSLSHISQYDIANHSWGFAQDFAVTNLPEGSVNTHSAMLATTQYAAGNGRSGLGTVMVTAGGNKRAQGGSAQGSMMNNSRFTIQVGASHTPGDLSTLRSSSAPFSNPGASLLISAPGNHVTTTSQIVKTDQGSIFGNQHSVIDGTSFATPIVSSIIALILEANPQLGYRDVQAILAACARKISDTQTQWNDNGAKNWNGGGMHASHDYGFGHIDAYAALRLAQTWTGKSTAENEFFYHAQSGPLNHSVSATQAFSTSLRLQNGVQVEHMEVDLDLSYADFKDVIVKLISPKGTQSILLNRPGQIPSEPAIGEKNDVAHINAGTLRYTFMSTHHWGERSEGEWTLQVSDATNGTPLTLNSWRIRAYGNKLSPDDTYIYTDEYKTLVAAQPHRAVLNDANNGIAGGRNTLNAAAVRGDTTINLNTGAANLGGTALSIVQPHTIHNLISGEGNDTLIAGPDNAVLDGGHGYNTLTGGAGKDIFVVRYRQQGCDTLTNFNAPYGEVIHLVGFSGKKYTDLTIQQEGKDTRVHCGTQQSIVLKNTVAANLNAQQFIFQDHLTLPEAYLNSASKVSTLPSGQGVINLNGGGTGISLTTENGQMVFKLTGTIYQRDNNFATNYFVIKAQTAGTKNYSNVLRGYKPGIDKIDLTQLGITHFNELKLEQTNRATVNGIATIRGTQIKSLIARNNMYGVDLSYLDSIDPAQLSERDFIFAQATPEQAGAIPSPIATISQPPAGTITPPQKVNTPTLFPEEKPSVITPSSPPNIPPPPGGIRPRLLLQGDDNDNNLKATRLSGDTTLKGLGGNDRLQGGSGNDLLDGRAGDDQMNGYLGSDTYLFYRGAGKDTIYEYTNPVGDTDVLAIIDPSISAEQLWFKKENTHLVMQLIGTQDRMMIESWIYWDQPLKNLNSPMEKLY